MTQDPYLPPGCTAADIDALSMSDREQTIAEDVESAWLLVHHEIDRLRAALAEARVAMQKLEGVEISVESKLKEIAKTVIYPSLRDQIMSLAEDVQGPWLFAYDFDLSFPCLSDCVADAIEETRQRETRDD